MKSARDQLDILPAYAELGSYRAAAGLCGTTPKTVRRVVERRNRPPAERPPRARNTDAVSTLVVERVRATEGRISAKRLLPVCRAVGYRGSARNLRRVVARRRRPATAATEESIDPGRRCRASTWSSTGASSTGCTSSARSSPWSRVRFVGFATDERQATTLCLLAECFETLGGVPAIVLTDRMGCLKGGVVTNVVVPAPGVVAFAAHYGFRPDFCEAADPLLHHSIVVVTAGDSFRMKEARARGGGPPPTP